MRPGPAVRAASLVALALLVAAGAGYAWMRYSPRSTPSGQPALARLDAAGLPALRDAFNASQGHVRLLVLLSPT